MITNNGFRLVAATGLALLQLNASPAVALAPQVVSAAKCSTFTLSPAVVKLGDSLSSDSQSFVVIPHVFLDGTVFSGGTLAITTTNLALGAAAGELSLNNIGISTSWATSMQMVSFKFAQTGGNFNLSVNGELANAQDFHFLNGTMLGGSLISVHTGADKDPSTLTLFGSIDNVTISGQELWIDDVCFEAAVTPPVLLPTKSDLGDAPDSTNHVGISNTAYAFPAVVAGHFPTVFDAATAISPPAEGQGPKHLSIAHAWLGATVTAEDEADQGADADGGNNILNTGADVSNMDGGDDGWLNQTASFANCATTSLVLRISRSTLPLPSSVPDLYLNVWFDGDRNGDWTGSVLCPGNAGVPVPASEWIVQNVTITAASVPLGGSVIVTLPTGLVPNSAISLTHWLRFTLSESAAPKGNAGAASDGRGPPNGYAIGETEDYLAEGVTNPPIPHGFPDVGDAPDSTNHWGATNTAYSVPPTAGKFPTVWDTSGSGGGGASGPKHTNPVHLESWLGNKITREGEADIGPDADGLNNIMTAGVDSSNRDLADDGWLNPTVAFPPCGFTILKVRISRDPAATLGKMYLNTWFDGNRDGDWEDIIDCPQTAGTPPGLGAEWIVRNYIINTGAIPTGTFADIAVPTQKIYNAAPNLNHWVRFTLSEQPLGTANATFNTLLTPIRADGRGLPFPGAF